MSMKMINLDNSGPLLDRHEELVRDSVANCDWTMEKQLEFEMQHRFVRVHSLELIWLNIDSIPRVRLARVGFCRRPTTNDQPRRKVSAANCFAKIV